MAFITRSNLFIKRTITFRSYSVSTTNDYVFDLFNGLVASKRSDLAKSITLIETVNTDKKKQAQLLLHKVLEVLKQKKNNNENPSLRIGAGNLLLFSKF